MTVFPIAFLFSFGLFLSWFSWPAYSQGEETQPTIIINEIYYDHPGSDSDHEWVELYNQGDGEVVIDTSGQTGWRFFDGQNHLLGADTPTVVLPAHGYGVIAKNAEVFKQDHPSFNGALLRSSITLANHGDTLKLSTDKGKTYFSEVTYLSSLGGNGNGYSLEFDQGVWRQSSVLGGTPGTPRSPSLSSTSPAEKKLPNEPLSGDLSSSNQKSNESLQSQTISEVKRQPLDTPVITQGTVTAPPEILSTKSFYIQDDASGIQIYSSKTPPIALGDLIRITGRRSQSNGEDRITIEPESWQILDNNQPIEPQPISLEGDLNQYEGQLVSVSGRIQIENGKLLIFQGDRSLTVLIRESTQIDKPNWRDGNEVSIDGIISPYRGQMRLLPRFQTDIHFDPNTKLLVPQPSAEGLTSTQPDVINDADADNNPTVGANSKPSKISNQKNNSQSLASQEKTTDSPAHSQNSSSSKKSKKKQSSQVSFGDELVGQVKGLLTSAPDPKEKIELTKAAHQATPKPTMAAKSGSMPVIFGIIIGALGAAIWQNRSLFQKVPMILKHWQKN